VAGQGPHLQRLLTGLAHVPARLRLTAADFVALVALAAVLTAAWIAGSAMSWGKALLAIIAIAAAFAAAWLELR
jgi:type IV secretory pathway VirB2 component (pilin)